MDPQAVLLAAAAAAAALAVGATLWALIARRAADAGVLAQGEQLTEADRSLRAARAAAEAFETAIISLGDGAARLVAGEESLAVCAERLGAPGGDAAALLEALRRADPNYAPTRSMRR